MRTFLHHFREHHTTEARCLWNNPDVFGDGPEEQPQSSEHQETTDATNAPEGVRVRIETAEEMETSVREEALKRMESADTESKKEEDLQTKLNREIGVLLESIKGLSSSEQGARVREFNEKFLHPLGHHLYLIDGNARISAYTPEDPRMAIYRAKIAELTAEISRTTTAINQARIHGIAPMAREYRGFKRGMMRRGNIAPEIQKFMMQFPATGASALAPDLKKMYEHLAKKQMELAQLKQAGWQSMPLPAPAPSPTNATPIREESAPRFQRRVPMDRMEFSRSLSALDPETQEQIRSLSPEFQQAIGGIASSLDEQEKADLRSLTEKLANGDFNAKINAPIFNPDGTLRTAQEIRTEIASHPMETETLEAIARFIDSLSPGEKQVMQIIIRQAQRLNEWKEDDRSSAEQIARYTDAWMKAKESGDEAGMEIAEGLLLMQGVEIDDKGKITPLEDNFGGKGMGFIMGLILVVDGFLKKIGEKMERKKKGEKQDETPDAEMTAEKKTEEMKKSEKKIEDLKKEQKDMKEKIQKGEEELAKEPPETKHVLQRKLDELKKELKRVEEEIKKENEKLTHLQRPDENKESPQDALIKKFNENKERRKAKKRAEVTKEMSNVDSQKREKLLSFLTLNDKVVDSAKLERNSEGKYRLIIDQSIIEHYGNIASILEQKPLYTDITALKTGMENLLKDGASAYGWHEENGNLLTHWISADLIETLDLMTL